MKELLEAGGFMLIFLLLAYTYFLVNKYLDNKVEIKRQENIRIHGWPPASSEDDTDDF